MAQGFASANDDGSDASRSFTSRRLLPVALCYIGLALIMVFRQVRGLPMANDPDDFLKLHEIRVLLQTGNVFDRTLPGILQPEPYVTHWPWIVDLPYAAVAWLVMPFTDADTALSVATFTVPLLLLVPALYFYHRLMVSAGFTMTAILLPVAAIVALPSFYEFAPDRIDYHNLEVAIFFAALALALSPRRAATVASGALVACGMAISLEFALFHALVVGIFVFDFVFSRKDGAARIVAFGGALGFTALLLFVSIVPPSAYMAGHCDTYSAPYALALVAAGLSFMALPLLTGRKSGPLLRAGVLLTLGGASMAAVAALFPLCLSGPYAGMEPHLRALALAGIAQELSFFQRPDLVLSGSFSDMTILFVGALAPAAFCLAARRCDRGLVVFALAALLALVQAFAYSRYLRYLPLFSGVGLLFVVAALLPPRMASKIFAKNLPQTTLRRVLPVVPGLVLAFSLALFHLTVKTAPIPVTALDLIGSCDATPSLDRYDWPKGAVVLTAPLVGAGLLAQQAGPGVVAIPNHPAARGIERARRFFDPATNDPQGVFDETRANLVAVCTAPAGLAEDYREEYPLVFKLMEGQPPSWLAQCPSDGGMPLHIYRRTDDTDALCPSVSEAN